MIYDESAVTQIGNTIYYKEPSAFAQGDLFFIPVEKVDDKILKIDSQVPGAIVLALGEVTGHVHAIFTDEAETVDIEGHIKSSPKDVPRAKALMTARYEITDKNTSFTSLKTGKTFKVERGLICLLRVGDCAPVTHDEHDAHMLGGFGGNPVDYIVIQQFQLHQGEMVQVQD